MHVDDVMMLYLRDPSLLRDALALERFLDQVGHLGFAVLPDSDQTVPSLADLVHSHPFHPGVHPDVLTLARRYGQQETPVLRCLFALAASSGEEWTLVCDLTCDSDQVLFLGVNEGYFKSPIHGMPSYERFLDLVQTIYRNWPIFFGYFLHEPDWEEDEIRQLRALTLYEIVVWGPEYVDLIGREQIHRQPIWKKISLADGGVMIALGTYRIYATHERIVPSQKDIAQELGLDATHFL